METKLVVISEFGGHHVGDEITDQKEVALILGSGSAHCVTKVLHDPAAEKIRADTDRKNAADKVAADKSAAAIDANNEATKDVQSRNHLDSSDGGDDRVRDAVSPFADRADSSPARPFDSTVPGSPTRYGKT